MAPAVANLHVEPIETRSQGVERTKKKNNTHSHRFDWRPDGTRNVEIINNNKMKKKKNGMPNASFIISKSLFVAIFMNCRRCFRIPFPKILILLLSFLLTHSCSPNVKPMTSNSFSNNCPPIARNAPSVSKPTHDIRQRKAKWTWHTTE